MSEAIELVRMAFGEDHLEFAMMQDKAGGVLEADGELAKAEQMYRKSLATRKRTLGENHPLTLESRASLAHVMARQGQVDESVTALRTVVAKFDEELGVDHPDYAGHCAKLALMLDAAEKTGGADRTASLADLRKALPPETVLVDFFVYEGSKRTKTDNGMRIAAFVVQSTGPVKRIELGAVAEIEAAVNGRFTSLAQKQSSRRCGRSTTSRPAL